MSRAWVLLLLSACTGGPTPTVGTPPPPDPVDAGTEAPTAPALPVASAILVGHSEMVGEFVVPIACVTHEGALEDGPTCAPRLVGLPAQLPAGPATLGELTQVPCSASGTTRPGLTASVRADAAHRHPLPFGFVSDALPEGWHIASRGEVSEAVAEAAIDALPRGSGWPLSGSREGITVTERMNLDGTLVLLAQAPPIEDKPGHSALLLFGNDAVVLPTDGLELNGAVTTPGALPVPGGGHLLIVNTEWMGGSGVHAIYLSPDGPVPMPGWACGT